jgi:hypothetical protein
MKRRVFLLTIVALLAALFPAVAQARMGTRLVAGQNQIVGWVFVDNDGENLTVTYETRYGLGFCLKETNLHVATSLDGIPQNNGNPTPGHFDYKGEHDCVREVVYTIPLGDWEPGTELFIAAHAVVGSWHDPYYEETGWGTVCGNIDNNPFPGSNWANYIPYTVKPLDPQT